MADMWYAIEVLLLAQIVADLWLGQEVLRRSRKGFAAASWQHLLAFLIIGGALLLPLGWWPAFLILPVAAIHLLVDLEFSALGLWVPDPERRQRRLYLFQAALKAATAAVSVLLVAPPAPVPLPPVLTSTIPYVLGYAVALWVGDAAVSLSLTKLPPLEDDGLAGAGRLVGVFEALIVTTCVIGHQYGAVGLVLAAKSVARFEWLRGRRDLAEYFLVGTLCNTTCAMFAGMLALWLAGRPIFATPV